MQTDLEKTRDTQWLREPLRTSVERLTRDSKAAGHPVWLGSGWRSGAQQIELRKKHCGTSTYAIYQMPSSSCHPITAKPGSSKHERGEAADLEGDLGYAHAHAAEYDIHFPLPSENWHAESTKATVPGLGSLGFDGLGAHQGLPTNPVEAAGALLGAVGFLTSPENWQRLLWLALGALATGWGVVIVAGQLTLA